MLKEIIDTFLAQKWSLRIVDIWLLVTFVGSLLFCLDLINLAIWIVLVVPVVVRESCIRGLVYLKG